MRKEKRKGVILALVVVFSLAVFSYAQEIPEWLKRTEFSFQYESDQKPTFFLQMVQPIYQSWDKVDTWFIQPRISYKSTSSTYNLGLGYRRLYSPALILGANVFGDYEARDEHARAGIGLEALGKRMEARLNGYFGLTSKREVESDSTFSTYERIADGADFEIGTPVPYFPWLKVYASKFWYDYKKSSDRNGWKTRLEARPLEGLCIEGYLWDDNKGEAEYGTELRFKIAFADFTLSSFLEGIKPSIEPYPERDLEEMLLEPVKREYEIVLEKWTEKANADIEIYRGD